ncbi:hypothetical protein N7467_003047 [Penicillium canescens]|nr:hypothetical protein N7467_003047 [Penicillium canescens]
MSLNFIVNTSTLEKFIIHELDDGDLRARVLQYIQSQKPLGEAASPTAPAVVPESNHIIVAADGFKAPINIMEQPSDSDENSSASEDSDLNGKEIVNDIQQFEDFLFKSNAFGLMETQLFDFIYPSFRSILMNWISNERRTQHSTPRKLRDLGIVISELQHIALDQISISSSDARSMTNVLKGKLEDFTGQVWDWWPLEPYMRGLARDEVRLHWRCTCGDARWAEVPISFAKKVTSATKILAASNESQSQSSQTTFVSQHSAPSTQHQAKIPNQNNYLSQSSASSRLAPHSQFSHRIANIPSQDPPLHVFLVLLSQPILDNYFVLAQKEIRRFDGYEYSPLKPDYPGPQEPYYFFDPKPMHSDQPIDPHQFAHWFYKQPGQPVGLRGLSRLFGRKFLNTTSNNRVVMLPKRETELEEGVTEIEDFWGLYIVERQSNLRAALWSLFLLPSIYFFFAWLFQWGHAGDLQNASVPIILLLGPLLTFWGNVLGNPTRVEGKQKTI